MITLKKLLEEQNWVEMSDIQIIRQFFTVNDLEEEGIDLIQELTKSKIKKMKYKQRLVQEWATILPSKYLYENYDLDIADKLHILEIDYLVNGGELSEGFVKWAEENFSNILRPQCYFNPVIDYLKDKGIEFKER